MHKNYCVCVCVYVCCALYVLKEKTIKEKLLSSRVDISHKQTFVVK